jgi:hypothetical protein
MAPSPSRISHLRPWLAVVTVSAALLVPAASAEAGWRISSNTLIEYRDVCRDGISFGGAVRATADPGSGSYKNRAIVVQPAPVNWEDWRNEKKIGQVMDSPISIPRKKDSIPVEDQDDPIDVAHEGDFRMRYQTGPLDIPEVDPQPLVLNLENGADGSGVVPTAVTDCYLYAAIDVQPGKSSNKVPIGHGEVSVAALGTNLLNAAALTPGDFRFGPAKAKAKASELRDVNGDNRDDLVLRFSSTKAGLKCSTKTAVLRGKTPTGGRYEGTDKVKPTAC